jgi:hypothetical protein
MNGAFGAAAGRTDISVVVPVYNEQENVPELHRRLAGTLEASRATHDELRERKRFVRGLRTFVAFRRNLER